MNYSSFITIATHFLPNFQLSNYWKRSTICLGVQLKIDTQLKIVGVQSMI